MVTGVGLVHLSRKLQSIISLASVFSSVFIVRKAKVLTIKWFWQ